MLAFIDFLNNREKASAIWSVAIIAYACTKNGKSIGIAFVRVVRAALQWKLLLMVASAGAYSAACVFLALRIGLWDRHALKETIYWFVGAGLIFVGDAVGSPGKAGLAGRVLKRTLRFALVLEFFVGLYVLPLWAELVVVPVVFLFVAMQALVSDNPAYDDLTRSFIRGVLVVIGLGLFAWALASVLRDSDGFVSHANAKRLFVAPTLSIALIPFLYVLSWYSASELRRLRARFL